MGQSINTGLVQAEVSSFSSPAIPQTGQDLIFDNISVQTTDTTMYTVPADKIFYLYGVQITESGTKNVIWGIDNTTTGKIIRLTATTTEANNHIASAVPIAKLVAAEVLVAKASSVMDGIFWGVLIDA